MSEDVRNTELMGHLTEATVSTWTNSFGAWNVSRQTCGLPKRPGKPWEVMRGSKRQPPSHRQQRCQQLRRRARRWQILASVCLELAASRTGPTLEPRAGRRLEVAEQEAAEPEAMVVEELDIPEEAQGALASAACPVDTTAAAVALQAEEAVDRAGLWDKIPAKATLPGQDSSTTTVSSTTSWPPLKPSNMEAKRELPERLGATPSVVMLAPKSASC